ncbi:type III-B CRISPR-associated protein Cas10/Cmr2 [Deltaproteobacteria bacterium TL4]
MSKKLLLISIGPVQEFIASARKLRDLWFGSYLLSQLSKTVARTLRDSGAELIFPSPQNHSDLEPDSALNVANKILAELPESVVPETLVTEVRKNLKTDRDDYQNKALKKVSSIGKFKINQDLVQQQMKDFGEFYAVWVELKDENYAKAKDQVERLLSARKNLRAFEKPTWDGTGLFKNSLDGLRETVIERGSEVPGLLKKSEKLDALGLVKRFCPLSDKTRFKQKFKDLADIALIPWEEKIKQHPEAKVLKQQFEACFGGDFSQENYYAENENKLELSDPGTAGEAWAILKKLRHKNMAGEPPKYACILVGDGDKMGPALDEIKDKQGHQIFSQSLAQFSHEVGNLIQKAQGSLIYSGGDDVMAYLPVHTALEGCDAIRQKFEEVMKNVCQELKLNPQRVPTLSIGLAIVHHSEPLDHALKLARNAEKSAKDQGGRNALAIIQSKRSGNDILIGGKWEKRDGKEGIVKRLQTMIQLYLEENHPLPGTLGYQLREAMLSAGDSIRFEENNDILTPTNAASALVLRTLRHKEKTHEQSIELQKPLKNILLGCNSIRELSQEMIVAKQIADILNLTPHGSRSPL